jgi:hypothetical protein
MERAPREVPFDEFSAFGFRRLYEDGLRLLGALGDAAAFPLDLDGVEELVATVTEAEPQIWPERWVRFAAEPPGELPRYTGERLIWVCPLCDGTLRLRTEEYWLSAAAATLSPDGRLSAFERLRGFGVPDAELTAQARDDRDLVERRRREAEAEAAESSRRVEEEQGRFRTAGLRGVAAAPWQEPAGVVVTWIAFYDPGFIVNHVMPGEAGDGLASLAIVDDLGNAYEEVGGRSPEPGRRLVRGSSEFVPGVPAEASRLIIRGDWGSVDVEVPR